MQEVTSNWTSAAAHALSFVKDTPLGRRSFGMSAQEAARNGGTLEANQFLSDKTEDDIAKDATFFHDMLHLCSLLHAVVSHAPATSVRGSQSFLPPRCLVRLDIVAMSQAECTSHAAARADGDGVCQLGIPALPPPLDASVDL